MEFLGRVLEYILGTFLLADFKAHLDDECLTCISTKSLQNLLQGCELVLNINSSQSLVNLMQDPLTLKAAASAIQAGHDNTVQTDQHRVPPEGEAITHSLTTKDTVTV